MECNKCGINKPKAEYSKGRYSCKPCDSRAAMDRAKAKRLENPELFAKKQLEATYKWRKNNREKYLELKRMQSIRARERKGAKPRNKRQKILSLSDKQDNLVQTNARQAWQYWVKQKAPDCWLDAYYHATGKPWNDPRLSSGEKFRMRYRMDKKFNLYQRLRRQIRKAKKRDGIGECIRQGLRRGGRSRVVEKRLGYSIAELKEHIEAQFIKRMSWEAYREGRIHIDHIVPQSAFDTHDDDEWRECWSLSNLRPMWARDNLIKKDTRELLL